MQRSSIQTVNELASLNNLSTDTLYIGEELKLPSKSIANESINVMMNTIVKKGDTLWSIASNNDINVNDLIKLNNLKSNTIIAGEKLMLPKLDTYTVKKGDTLYSIATKYNTNVNDLMKLNDLSNYTIVEGQELKIKNLNAENRNSTAQIITKEHKYHKVITGETIYSVAASNGLSVSELKKLNTFRNKCSNYRRKFNSILDTYPHILWIFLYLFFQNVI